MTPEWVGESKNWLIDGYNITKSDEGVWNRLDWQKSWVDIGPSPAGNLGPYWHVPMKEHADNEGGVHRLYPKVMRTKWAEIIHVACKEYAESEKLRAKEGKDK